MGFHKECYKDLCMPLGKRVVKERDWCCVTKCLTAKRLMSGICFTCKEILFFVIIRGLMGLKLHPHIWYHCYWGVSLQTGAIMLCLLGDRTLSMCIRICCCLCDAGLFWQSYFPGGSSSSFNCQNDDYSVGFGCTSWCGCLREREIYCCF